MFSGSKRVDGAAEVVVMELQDETGRMVSMGISPEVCDSPLCACAEMRLRIQPNTPENAATMPEEMISIDLILRTLIEVEGQPLSPATRALAESLMAKLTPELWEQMRNYFVEIKEAQLACADLAALKPDFPRELAWDPSMLVSYGIIVPHARPLLFDLEGLTWQAMDDYCVNPDCTCQDAYLTFRAWLNGAPWGPLVHEGDIDDAPVACLSLSGSAWDTEEASPAGIPGVERLMAALEDAWPDLRALMQARRTILRHMAEAPGSIVGSGPQTPVQVRSTKVGRNEPCPCGSGKKYKRCCG